MWFLYLSHGVVFITVDLLCDVSSLSSPNRGSVFCRGLLLSISEHFQVIAAVVY